MSRKSGDRLLLSEQEVPGSNPGAPTEVQPQALRCGDTTTHFAMRVRCRTPLQTANVPGFVFPSLQPSTNAKGQALVVYRPSRQHWV